MANNAKQPFAVLLLTRPTAGNVAFWNALSNDTRTSLARVDNPLIGIVPLTDILTDDVRSDVIFTSSNAIPLAGAPCGRNAYCIGTRTTRNAQDAGWQAVCLGQDADALVAAIQQLGIKGPLLHIAGLHTRGNVAKRLTAIGIPTTHRPVYRQDKLPLQQPACASLIRGIPVIVPLFSPRTAEQFASETPGHHTAPLHLVALSQAVKDELSGLHATSVHVCASPALASMVETVQNVAEQVTLG